MLPGSADPLRPTLNKADSSSELHRHSPSTLPTIAPRSAHSSRSGHIDFAGGNSVYVGIHGDDLDDSHTIVPSRAVSVDGDGEASVANQPRDYATFYWGAFVHLARLFGWCSDVSLTRRRIILGAWSLLIVTNVVLGLTLTGLSSSVDKGLVLYLGCIEVITLYVTAHWSSVVGAQFLRHFEIPEGRLRILRLYAAGAGTLILIVLSVLFGTFLVIMDTATVNDLNSLGKVIVFVNGFCGVFVLGTSLFFLLYVLYGIRLSCVSLTQRIEALGKSAVSLSAAVLAQRGPANLGQSVRVDQGTPYSSQATRAGSRTSLSDSMNQGSDAMKDELNLQIYDTLCVFIHNRRYLDRFSRRSRILLATGFAPNILIFFVTCGLFIRNNTFSTDQPDRGGPPWLVLATLATVVPVLIVFGLARVTEGHRRSLVPYFQIPALSSWTSASQHLTGVLETTLAVYPDLDGMWGLGLIITNTTVTLTVISTFGLLILLSVLLAGA